MKKIVLIAIFAVTAFVSYQSARFFVIKSYKKSSIDAVQSKQNYPLTFDLPEKELAEEYFEQNIDSLWVKMFFSAIVWTSFVIFIIFLINKKNDNSNDDFYHVPIWTFAVVGILLIPLLLKTDIQYAYWIMK